MPVFRSWYTRKSRPPRFFTSPVIRGLMAVLGTWLSSPIYTLRLYGWLAIPKTKNSAALFSLFIARFSANVFRPGFQTTGHFRARELSDWITLMNGFYDFGILIGDPPEDLL